MGRCGQGEGPNLTCRRPAACFVKHGYGIGNQETCRWSSSGVGPM